ncbi:hypothetical protein HBI81_256550 [Parastagonospora nodorum]|nr:hypothetical protein HBI18_241290 [Parastagonospora nodorum]KAH6510775.1 hypothetical protein HBI81_256550 [Parastagonospora nodorum]
MKLSSISKGLFADVRTSFIRDLKRRWNWACVEEDNFWLDLGREEFSENTSATYLRKTCCNLKWASALKDPYTKADNSVKITTFPWAGTIAGSIFIDTALCNRLRLGGIGPCKGYNVIKEQHASQMKGLSPWQDPLFETLGA